MRKQDGKGLDREKRDETKAEIQREWFRAPRRSASSDGEARCSSALDLQATITDVTNRNRHVSAIALLQGEGSEGTVNRESVDTYMELPDADAVKAANCAFFLGEEVLPNDDWTDLEPDHVQRGAGGPVVKTTNKKTL